MATINTYGALAEEIITQYGKKIKSDNPVYSIRHIAEMIAQEQAYFAKGDALEQSNMGESTYANDQFITSYNGLAVLTDGQGSRYIPMPNPPAGLPQGREIAYVGFSCNKKWQVFPMRSKDRFMQNFVTTPSWMILCYVDGGNIVIENPPKLLGTDATADIKLVGAAPIGELVDQVLNMPKSTQTLILDKILARLNSERNILPHNVNDTISK